MNITKDEFMLLVQRSRFLTDPGFGYARYEPICPSCNERIELEEMIYTKGFNCYMCGYIDENYGWGPLSQNGFLDGPCLTPVGATKARTIYN